MVTLKELLWSINIWWEKKENIVHLAEKKKREELKQILEEERAHRTISLIGPRRTGKTILIFQTIEHLISKGVDPKRILFVSLDNNLLRAITEHTLEEVFKLYFDEILYQKPHELKETVYIFLDEVHKVKNWAEWLKNKYDFYRKIKFIISGSSALKISEKSKETLAGRTVTIKIFPLDFYQFLCLNDLKIKKPVLNLEQAEKQYSLLKAEELKIKKLFNLYLLVGGFIEWFKLKDIYRWQKYLHEDILNKLILSDIFEEYDVKDEEGLRRITLVLSENLGNLYSLHSLAKLSMVGKDVIEKYLSHLKNGFLAYELNNYSRHIKVKLRKNKKINLIDIGIVNAIKRATSLREAELADLIEQVVQNHCFYFSQKENREIFFYRDREGHEVDAILRLKKLLPIEVKYKNQINKKDLKGLLFFMDKFKISQGVVLTKALFKKERIANKKLYFIPVWLFLLLI